MATQRAIKRLRSRSALLGEATAEVPDVAPSYPVEAWITFRKVLQAVNSTQAEIAVHYFLDGMSQDEIGAFMGLPRRTVGHHLERFCSKARRLVGEVSTNALEEAPRRAANVRGTP
jgi:DNA-directed RNA polymerase specialized sigma24 family protein